MSIRVEKHGPVTTVILDRPDARNAVDGPTALALYEAFEEFDRDESASVAVLWGDHGTFCAGADLKAMGTPQSNPLTASGPGPMGPTRMTLSKPVIAAVSGPAVGGGFALATAADVRFGSPDAMFIAPFLKLAVSVGDMGLSWMLPRLIGPGAAAEVLYSGTPLGAVEAHRLGLLQHVVPDPLESAITLAVKIAGRPRLAVRMSKELLNASISAGGLREHMETEMRSQVIGLMSADHRAALKEFAARRKKN